MRDYDRAMEYLQGSLDLRRKIGNKWGVAATLGTIGWAALL